MKTMTFEVWHTDLSVINDAYRFPKETEARWLHHPEQFIKVAEVEASSLDQVWEITQNVNDSWTKQQKVKWSSNHELRSSAVGDVILQGKTAWLISEVGFTKIEELKAGTRKIQS